MVLPLSMISAGADGVIGESTAAAFDAQTVDVDLSGATIGNGKFSAVQYPYVLGATVADMQIITLMEYGFSNCDNTNAKYNDYALYLYVYNPGNVSVSERDLRHKVTLAVGNGGYEKYCIQLLSHTGDGEHDYLLLKFKVSIGSADLRGLVQPEARRYKMSEFEIAASGADNAKATTGGTWTYTGYMAGFGDAKGTLDATVEEMKVCSLDLSHCVWRTNSSPLGDGYKTQVDTVYFAIPNKVLEAYGEKIAKIHYECYQYDTGYVLVCRDDDNGNKLFTLMKPYESVTLDGRNNSIPTLNSGRNSIDGSIFWSNFVYNNRGFVQTAVHTADRFTYVIQMPASTGENAIIETELQDRLTSDWTAYNNGASQTTFTGDKAENYQENNIGDEAWSVDVAGAAKWYEWLFNAGAYKSQDENIASIEPIHIVQASDFNNFSSALYIDDYYKDDVSAAYNQAIANDESLVVFHFATSDYYSKEVESNSYLTDSSDLWVYGDPAFVAKETVYMDFDVIDITFEKNGVYTVLPVVSSPIHAIADLQTPDATGIDSIPDWMLIALAIVLLIAVVLILSLFMPFLKPIVNVIAWILFFPFRLIWMFFKAIGKGIAALIRRCRNG